LASTGIYIFEPEILDYIPQGWSLILAASCFPGWWSWRALYAQRHEFNWIDIGRLTDYWDVLQRVLRAAR
jgi:mannose-1-phosphate guanylyltransferase